VNAAVAFMLRRQQYLSASQCLPSTTVTPRTPLPTSAVPKIKAQTKNKYGTNSPLLQSKQ
jgi:hypothetical protein